MPSSKIHTPQKPNDEKSVSKGYSRTVIRIDLDLEPAPFMYVILLLQNSGQIEFSFSMKVQLYHHDISMPYDYDRNCYYHGMRYVFDLNWQNPQQIAEAMIMIIESIKRYTPYFTDANEKEIMTELDDFFIAYPKFRLLNAENNNAEIHESKKTSQTKSYIEDERNELLRAIRNGDAKLVRNALSTRDNPNAYPFLNVNLIEASTWFLDKKFRTGLDYIKIIELLILYGAIPGYTHDGETLEKRLIASLNEGDLHHKKNNLIYHIIKLFKIPEAITDFEDNIYSAPNYTPPQNHAAKLITEGNARVKEQLKPKQFYKKVNEKTSDKKIITNVFTYEHKTLTIETQRAADFIEIDEISQAWNLFKKPFQLNGEKDPVKHNEDLRSTFLKEIYRNAPLRFIDVLKYTTDTEREVVCGFVIYQIFFYVIAGKLQVTILNSLSIADAAISMAFPYFMLLLFSRGGFGLAETEALKNAEIGIMSELVSPAAAVSGFGMAGLNSSLLYVDLNQRIPVICEHIYEPDQLALLKKDIKNSFYYMEQKLELRENINITDASSNDAVVSYRKIFGSFFKGDMKPGHARIAYLPTDAANKHVVETTLNRTFGVNPSTNFGEISKFFGNNLLALIQRQEIPKVLQYNTKILSRL